MIAEPNRLLTVKAASDRLGVSKSLVYTMCREGKLRHCRIGVRGRGRILIHPDDVEAFIRSSVVEPYDDLDDGDLQHLR